MATFLPNVTDVFPEPSLFTPDFSYMDHMLRRRQALYDQGFAQVSSKYDFVNRALTNPANVKTRDIFLKQAKDNLKNLSGMDLSDAQNVESAKGVFEPWVNNTNALWDATLTDHWNKQEQLADNYRHQDGGKYFNQANLDYVKKQKMAFANDDANNWKSYYDNKRSYTEYYDYHKEIQDLMKDFKPSTYKVDKIKGLYKITDENASWTDAEIRKYLDANLSEKAKQQMRIEGDVKYNNDPKALGQVVIAQSQDQMSKYDAGIAFIDKRLGSETDKEKIADLKQYRQTMLDRKAALNSTINTIKSGDYTLIKKRGEEIAADLYTTETMTKISNGFSHQDVVHKIDGDSVGLEIYRQGQENERQLRGFAHAEKMARLKGEIAGPPQLTQLETGEVEQAGTIENIQADADKLRNENATLEDANKTMVLTWMKQVDPALNKNKTVKDVSTSDILAFKTKGLNGQALPSTHPFKVNEQKMHDNEAGILIKTRRIDEATNRVLATYTPEQKAALKKIDDAIAEIGTITLDDGSTISGKDLYNGMRSGAVKIEGGGYIGGATYDIKINGKTISAFNNGSSVKNGDLLKAVNTIKGLQKNNAYQKLTNDVSEYFEKHAKELSLTSDVMSFAEKSAEKTMMENEMSGLFPKAQYDVQSAGIGASAENQGTAYFYITGKGENAGGQDQIIANLHGRGYKDVVAHPVKGSDVVLYEIKNYKSPVTQQYSQFNNSEKLAIHDIATETAIGDSGEYTTGPFKSNSDRTIQLKREGNYYYLLIQGLDGGNTMDMFPYPYTNPAEAVMFAQKLTATDPMSGVKEAGLKNYLQLANKK